MFEHRAVFFFYFKVLIQLKCVPVCFGFFLSSFPRFAKLVLQSHTFLLPFQIYATWKQRTPSLHVRGVLLASTDSRVSAALLPPTTSFTRTLLVSVKYMAGCNQYLLSDSFCRAADKHRQRLYVCEQHSHVNTCRNWYANTWVKYTKYILIL